MKKKQSEYYEKLKDPRWQKKRLEIFERDGWECKYCHRKTETLHVHHIFYLPKTEPWDVPNGLLVTLCEDCHKPGPCEGHTSCETCSDFGKDCDGYASPVKDLQTEICNLLSSIWEYKKCDSWEFIIRLSGVIDKENKE